MILSFTKRLLGIAPLPLVDMRTYRRAERIKASGGVDPIEVLVAYAQDSLIYTPENRIKQAKPEVYETTPSNDRVNKFGRAYRAGVPLLLHKRLADVVVDAAIDLKCSIYNLRLRLYDGLRTVDAAQTMYDNADPAWLAAGLLAKPGHSAHNRALAVDSSVVNIEGRESERLDDLDMPVNHRDYNGDRITDAQHQMRLIKEQAFQRAAIKNGLALAPLASEYWDDRVPGSEKDLWRVINSLARCTGQSPPENHAEDYATFAQQWRALNANDALTQAFGEAAKEPPAEPNLLFHELLPPLYDRDLPAAWRQSIHGGKSGQRIRI